MKKKICIVFRGAHIRERLGQITNALDCIDNWKKTLFNSLIDYDITLFTYPSDVLNQLIDILKPIHVCTEIYNTQCEKMSEAVQWMIDNPYYERYVLLRLDIVYRIPITQWNNWDKKGVIIGKDVSWPTRRLYHDMVYIIDKEWVHDFYDAVNKPNFNYPMHTVGMHLYKKQNVPLWDLYDGYYHGTQNKLFVIRPFDPDPDLDKPNEGWIKLDDVSPWNNNDKKDPWL